MLDANRREDHANGYRTTEPLLYTLAEAAALLQCRQRWLMMQLRAGRFPARKVQRAWRMSAADIERAIELCAVQPPQDSDDEGLQPTPLSRRMHGGVT